MPVQTKPAYVKRNTSSKTLNFGKSLKLRPRRKQQSNIVKYTDTFASALSSQMRLHKDTCVSLNQAVARTTHNYAHRLIARWANGRAAPRWPSSFLLLRKIERYYRLPAGYFIKKLYPQTPTTIALKRTTPNQQHIVRWHLPDNFDLCSKRKQKEILTWIDDNVLTGSTEFGKFIRKASQSRYAIRFPTVQNIPQQKDPTQRYFFNAGSDDIEAHGEIRSRLDRAPPRLTSELINLIQFKRSTLAPAGFHRYTGWSEYSSELQIRTYGRFFGALVASPRSSIGGHGVPLSKLTFALFVMPSVWDWYLGWREKKRGFFSNYERNTLVDVMSLTRRQTGWLRQHPELAENLTPIKSLITRPDILAAQTDWPSACDRAREYLASRVRELNKISRVHRDPFEKIITVLTADKPLAEYRKITVEMLRRMPDATESPQDAAETVRAYLMLRFGMHLGLRQRNLRELLLCPRGNRPTPQMRAQAAQMIQLFRA